jgi:PHD/YefM family antitoxin component YafN of YafNO toxin-antitoxin module
MKLAQITDLKNTSKVAETVRDADVVVTRNGETEFYMVNPHHFEALVEIAKEAGIRATETFMANYAKRRGDGALAGSYAAALRGEFASKAEEDEVFGEE